MNFKNIIVDELTGSPVTNLGGKANSLKLLHENLLPIPEFYIIPSSIFKRFLEENKLVLKIQNYIIKKDFDKIVEIIINAKFNKEIEDYIYQEFDKLGAELVAVRSSAIEEDGLIKSFAGQYNSFLNIKKEGVLESIKKCWSSLYNENAINYQDSSNIDIFGMNVIIQKMINPIYSGVGFSVNPISVSKNYSCIEACKGTAENLVSGLITPTTYLVRRETKRVDYLEGEDLLSNTLIEKLENFILKIEKIYEKPVDIEWCYSDDIYILQARPITAFAPRKEPIKNMLTRQKRLWQIEIYCKGEYFGIKDLTNNLYYQNPIIYFISPKITEVYYNYKLALEESPNMIFRALDDSYDVFCEKIDKAAYICEEILKLIQSNKFDFKTIANYLLYIHPFNALGNIAGGDWKISNRVKNKIYEYRNKYDYILYNALDALDEYLLKTMPKKFKKYLPVLSIEDIVNPDSIDTNTLEERLKGFIYYQGKIYKPNLKDFCDKRYLYVENLKDNDGGVIHGTTAYPGKCIGIVKIIYSKEDFEIFNEGDIIVSPMTTPKFTSIMKIASGIITDEGGVTCHASIVARELKKPCIIGCKNATKILKNGMKVELDSTNGTISIIND